MIKKRIIKKLYIILLLIFSTSCLYGEEIQDEDLLLDDLLNLTVSSVTASELKLKDTPAAAYVITADDIKRAGFQSIPEALRLVPGLQVSQTSSNLWSISSRGFNRLYSNKLLVMVDGRNVSSALFSGVFWESQDLILEDIERIEIIRGPGAVLWGSGAVNGVINIITKKAEDVQGTYLKLAGGSHYRSITALRHAGEIDDDLFYKFSLKYRNIDSTANRLGGDSADDWSLIKGDLRVDWNISKFTELSLSTGIAYSDQIGTSSSHLNLSPTPSPALANLPIIRNQNERVNNYNILLNLKHEFSVDHRIVLGGFFDGAKRIHPIGSDRRQVYDLNFKDFHILDGDSQIVWGLGFRATRDHGPNAPEISVSPQKTLYTTASGLMEYTKELIPNQLIFTIGSKFEANDYTGFEVQPSARLSYHFNENNFIWTSVSRAVRNPARFEDSASLNGSRALSPLTLPLNSAVVLRGSSQIESEVLQAYELGYRSQLSSQLNIDVALFYNKYSKLITAVVDPSTVGVPTTPVVLNLSNQGSADTYGVETSINWQATDDWRLAASYTFFRSDEDRTSDDPLEDSAPRNAANLQSHYQIVEGLSFNANLYYKDNIVRDQIKHYTRLDLGLIWEVKENIELSIWGQNLLKRNHLESRDELFGGEESFIERSIYAQLTAKF